MLKLLPVIVIISLLMSSCMKNNQTEIDAQAILNQAKMDDQAIQDYLSVNKVNATKDPSGLYYVTTLVGTGISPASSSTVEVKYKGWLLNGTLFDQTATDKKFTYALSGLIKGWQIGIPLMKKGGKATFFIPSSLGYGYYATGPIPANSVLIFDIELIDVK
jgi:FKBP-type peptidyl-prolyl cis-trans isomerase FkpA